MKHEIGVGYIATVSAGLLFGFVPIVSAKLRDEQVSSLEQTLLRLTFAFVFSAILLGYYWTKTPQGFYQSLALQLQKVYLIQGLLMTLMVLSYLSSIALDTPAGEAALLVQVQPFVTLFFAWLILHEKVTVQKIGAVVVAMIGLILLTQPWEWNSFLSSLTGDLLAMANGTFYSIYILVGRGVAPERKKIPHLLSIAWILVWSMIIGIPLIWLFNLLPLDASLVAISVTRLLAPAILFLGFLLAVVASVLPYGLLMVSAKHVESSRASILLLGEPIGAILFGWMLLHEVVTIWYALGALLLLVAIVLVVSGPEQNASLSEIQSRSQTNH